MTIIFSSVTIGSRMRKEVIIAIFLGVVLGLILTFGFWTANQAVKDKKTEKTVQVVDSSPQPSAQIGFYIQNPENNLVVDKSNLEISGRSQPQAAIVAYSADSQAFTQADEQGYFVFSFNLTKGSNKITLISIDKQEKTSQKELMVVYTTDLE